MRIYEKLGLGESESVTISWDITPADTFGMFESWGGKERVRNKRERFYYFYIDNWEPPAKLFFMERGIKFARIMARIDAPQEMIDACVATQGKGLLDKSYAIDKTLKQWIKENVLNTDDTSKIIPMESGIEDDPVESGLPKAGTVTPPGTVTTLRSATAVITEDSITDLIKAKSFFESQHNPGGSFKNLLVDNDDGITVTDLATGIMWQRGGCDITTIKRIQTYVEKANGNKLAGFDGWRLPTMEEGLSLLEPVQNEMGLYLNPCFSKKQPFIFLADQRKPGGYWFIDFKQGVVFWASGTIPGGFGRLCRTAG